MGRFVRWLDAVPHPALACEIAASHVAAARWTGGRRLESYDAIEGLPEGAVVPSPVEPNVLQHEAVRQALGRVLSRVPAHAPETTLLVPDQVVRIFLLHFDTFPRRADEAVPLLRWRLKKSVPFDVDDTVVSFMQQPSRGEGVDVLAGVARQRIIREYEELATRAGLVPGVVVSSTLATLPLIEDDRPTLLARLAGATLTSVIVRGPHLCVYRCTEMSGGAEAMEPQALFEEVYPAVAYYQDTWKEDLQQVRLAGFGARTDEFRAALEAELGCSAGALSAAAALEDRLTGEAKAQVDRQMDSLVGWMLNRGA